MNLSFNVPRIEARLAATGVSVNRFCKTIGVNRSTWTRWKRGQHMPRFDKLCAAMNKLELFEKRLAKKRKRA